MKHYPYPSAEGFHFGQRMVCFHMPDDRLVAVERKQYESDSAPIVALAHYVREVQAGGKDLPIDGSMLDAQIAKAEPQTGSDHDDAPGEYEGVH